VYIIDEFKVFVGSISCRGLGATLLAKVMRSLGGPKYDGKYLHQVVREKLGEIRLHETLTNIVVPTFDIKTLQPIIFSSYQVNLFLMRLY